MLIVCNGAFKSGSTWLYRIIKVIIRHKAIPPRFHAEDKWHGESIAGDKLPEFLETVDYKNENYVCKSHYDDVKIRDLLLAFDDVYILNIKRDLRDVITSAYYHFNREDGIDRSFEEFYWGKGRSLIGYIDEYHDIWHNLEGKIYVSSYRLLHEDFEDEVRRISDFLNYPLKPGDLERLKEKTSMNASRKLWKEESKSNKERFFRKGIIGDWENHFTPEIEADFNKMNRTVQPRNPVIKKKNRFLSKKIRSLKKLLFKKWATSPPGK